MAEAGLAGEAVAAVEGDWAATVAAGAKSMAVRAAQEKEVAFPEKEALEAVAVAVETMQQRGECRQVRLQQCL